MQGLPELEMVRYQGFNPDHEENSIGNIQKTVSDELPAIIQSKRPDRHIHQRFTDYIHGRGFSE